MASESIFPDEIIIEILLKLPVKSILRCTTLSKHYYSLIHSKYFSRRHRTLGPLNDQSIISPIHGSVHLLDRRGHIQVLPDTPPFTSEPSIISHGPGVCPPVEGLYCVLDPFDDRFAIWNPTTREHFISPPVPLTPDTGESESELGNRQCYVYGFGYDDTTDEYKFVFNYAFFPDNSNDLDVYPPIAKSSFNIYNISKGEWRSIEPWSGVVPWGVRFRIGVFVHGACHWNYASSDSLGFMILAFNIVTESHRFIPLPVVGDEYVWSNVFIVSINGCLGLVNTQKRDNTPGLFSSFDVWVMAEYGVTQSWTILIQVVLPDGISGRFLGIVRDRFYIRKCDGCMVSYDLYSKDEERYDIVDKVVVSLLPYEESLVRIIKSVS